MESNLSRRGLLSAFGFSAIAGPAAMACMQETLCAESISTANELPIRILYNENPLGCSPLARQAAIDSLKAANFYPYDVAAELTSKLKAKHGLDDKIANPEHVITLAGGSSELLLASALAFSLEGGNLVTPNPSYEAVARFSSSRPGPKMEIRSIPLLSDGAFDIDKMLASVDDRTKILLITNPNNPTGQSTAKATIERMIDTAPETCLVLVDEAYIDFLENPESHSVVAKALQKKNVLVLRTFSKLHGMAGMRVGYAVGHRSIIEHMQYFRAGSFGLNVCGLAAAIASLDDVDFQNASRKMARDSRERITKQLTSLGCNVMRTDAACLWADFGRDARPLVGQLSDRGIQIASGMRWNSPNCVRISVATEWQTTQLLDAINQLWL